MTRSETDRYFDPQGPHSYYVSLTIATAIIADSEEEAKQRLLDSYVKELPMTGWESYGKVEWKITPGPPIQRLDK